MLARRINPDIKRPVDAGDDKEERPGVLEWCIDPGFFLHASTVERKVFLDKECMRTWSSRRAACAGVSPGSTLPPNPLYL